MKQKRFIGHLAFVLKASLFLLICLSCSDDDLMDGEKAPCEHLGEKIMEVTSIEATLYYIDGFQPFGIVGNGLTYSVIYDSSDVLITFENEKISASVCNFPASAKKLKGLGETIPVIMSGNVYQTLNEYNELVKVFELTQLKKR